jgi:hypothetical protein
MLTYYSFFRNQFLKARFLKMIMGYHWNNRVKQIRLKVFGAGIRKTSEARCLWACLLSLAVPSGEMQGWSH